MELILITPSYSLLNHFPPFCCIFFFFCPGLSLSFSFTICPWFLSVLAVSFLLLLFKFIQIVNDFLFFPLPHCTTVCN